MHAAQALFELIRSNKNGNFQVSIQIILIWWVPVLICIFFFKSKPDDPIDQYRDRIVTSKLGFFLKCLLLNRTGLQWF